MAAQKHILVVDDQKPFREISEIHLVGDGYRVTQAEDGIAMRKIMVEDPADLVLVDLTLPGENGLSLVRYLREQYVCGIIVVSARNALMDRVVGLEVGADDYIPKPYDPPELLARVRSLLRRLEAAAAAAAAAAASTVVGEQPIAAPSGSMPLSALSAAARELVTFAHWQFDVAARHLIAQNGQVIDLTAGEFNLLNEFVSNPGVVLSREHLLQAVHSRNWDYFDRSIDVLVTRLRRKLEISPEHPTIIKTVRGAGYLFAVQIGNKIEKRITNTDDAQQSEMK